MRVIRPAITGNYDLSEDISQADSLIGQSFGNQSDNPGYTNGRLAEFVDKLQVPELPLFLQSEVAESFIALQSTANIAKVIKGVPSTSIGAELDSWEVLRQSYQLMREMGLNSPIIVAQAHHVGRVSLQAIKQGMNPIILPGLPREFDANSEQPWTRSKALWIPRELVGLAYLKVKHKL